MKTFKVWGLGLLIILFIIFVVQNLSLLSYTERLRLNLLFTSFQSPPLQVALLMFICFFLGLILAYGLGLIQKQRLKRDIKELQERYSHSEKELNSLRNLPVTGEVGPGAESRHEEKEAV